MQVAQGFYAAYFLSLIQDILYVLTDRLHKANLSMHAQVLSTMLQMVESLHVVAPLWESAPGGAQTVPAGTTNPQFLRVFVKRLIASSFPNLAEYVFFK